MRILQLLMPRFAKNTESKDVNNERKTVAVLTGSFYMDYSRKLAKTLCDALSDEGDFSVCLLQGLDASRFLNFGDYVDDGFDSHYYTQFEYCKYLKPDYLVVSYGTISVIPNALTANELLDRLPDVPVILLETELRRPNCVSIVMDNYAGMKSCIEHLIVEHGCREILFVAGSDGVPDAGVRLRAYCDTMRSHNIDVSDDMIGHGDFTDHVEPQIEALLKSHPHPDAIVCSNDEMAECAYRILRLHGMEPGRDVAVTGFDDSTAASYMMPPLTSVRQDLDELTQNIIHQIRAFDAGTYPDRVLLPAKLQVRQSCGCICNNNSSEPYATLMNEGRSKIKRLTNRNILTALMLRKLLREDVSRDEFFLQLGRLLHALEIEYSEIRLLPEPVVMDTTMRMIVPDQLHLQMRQNGDVRVGK